MEKAKAQKKENRTMIMRTLKFMIGLTWKERPSLFCVYGLLFVAQLLQKIQVVILPKFLIDELMLIWEGAPVTEHLQKAILYVALICGTNLLVNVMNNASNQWRSVLNEWFNEYFEAEMAGYAMQMDFEHTEDPNALDQLNRAKEGIWWYSGGVVGILNSIYNLISSVTVLLGVSIIIAVTCPILLPVQLVALLVMAFFNKKNNLVEVESYSKISMLDRVYWYYMFDLADFSRGKEIRLYDSVDMMSRKMEGTTKGFEGVWKNKSKRQRGYHWGMDLANAVRDGISYFYIGFLALTKKISVGDFAMCVASASELYHGLRGVVLAWQEIMKCCSYVNDYLKLPEYTPTFSTGTRAVTGEKHCIEFVNVGFKYPRSEQYVLKNINLKIVSGEHLSVVGLNGAGKTTFIKLLCRLYDVTEGEILIDGVNIKEYSDEEYRKLFAVVFQDFKLFAFSLKENIAFGEEMREEDINRVLELSGFYEDTQKLPEGLDTMIYKSFDENGMELSGGQQQKVAIARALYKDAPIVILDEPTAALDPIAEYDIYRRFDTLIGGKTAIYISHRLSSCKFCDKIAVFAENTIKEYGTHDELVDKQNGIYAELFATQAQHYIASS